MSFIIFDAHCDTLSLIADSKEGLRENSCHVDLMRLKKGKGYIQTFAAFADKRKYPRIGQRINNLIDVYYQEISKNADMVRHCTNSTEIDSALKHNCIASLLAIEGGDVIEGSVKKLREFYDKGVRIMTLTWNYANELCDGIGEICGGGLTASGRAVVGEMNRLGMVIDVSHISEQGFWDVAACSTKPIIASHSNVKRLCRQPRNLNDEQIKAIFDVDGCIGVTLCPDFVCEKKASAEKVVDHIEYLLDMGGENHIGIGSDFDGIEALPFGMTGAESMEDICEIMEKRNFSEKLIKKITSENFLRVIKLVCG